MKIGIISDTHDDIINTNKAIDVFKENNVMVVIHAGDFVAPPVVSEFKRLSENGVAIYGVFGNNDGEKNGLKEAFEDINGKLFDDVGKIEIENLKFGIYHGTDVRKKEKMIESGKFDVFICGHTHRKVGELIGKSGTTIVLNPGTAHCPTEMYHTPSGYFKEATILIFDTLSRQFEFYDLSK